MSKFSRVFLRITIVLVMSMGVSVPTYATTYSTDFSDIWWNPAESGWGVNLIQQNDIIFATLFVYGPDSTATWYVASNLTGNGNTFSGALYHTTGPAFSGVFNPSAVSVTQVGNMSVTFNTASTGVLTYTVNGVSVNKSIQRQTWRTTNFAGNYLGGLTAQATSCRGSVNGPILIFDTLEVRQTDFGLGFQVKFTTASGAASVCTFVGDYTQTGRLGSTTGSWSCTVGGVGANFGTYTMTAIEAGVNGFTAKFVGQDQYCNYNGFFGGVRDVL